MAKDETGGVSRPPTKSPGADDGGSAVVAALEMYRILVTQNFVPDRTLEFHWYVTFLKIIVNLESSFEYIYEQHSSRGLSNTFSRSVRFQLKKQFRNPYVTPSQFLQTRTSIF